jgi:hypothetical protein
MEIISKNNFLNIIYQSGVLSITAIGYSWLLKRIFNIKIGDPSSPNCLY